MHICRSKLPTKILVTTQLETFYHFVFLQSNNLIIEQFEIIMDGIRGFLVTQQKKSIFWKNYPVQTMTNLEFTHYYPHNITTLVGFPKPPLTYIVNIMTFLSITLIVDHVEFDAKAYLTFILVHGHLSIKTTHKNVGDHQTGHISSFCIFSVK